IAAGHRVSVVGFGSVADHSDACKCRQDWIDAGGEVIDPDNIANPQSFIVSHELIIDALLGTGLSRPAVGQMRRWIQLVNQSSVACLAADVPSGLNSDSGALVGSAIRSVATTTFIGRKQGLFTGQARAYVGDVEFDDLAVPEAIYGQITAQTVLLQPGKSTAPLIPQRQRDSHKGDHGHLLIIGAGVGMPGAAAIAAQAALKTGAGLVTVAVHPDNVAAVAIAQPEMMVHGVQKPADLQALIARANVIAIGPGLGAGSWAKSLWGALKDYSGPLVVDADGLNLLAAEPIQRSNWVLTPHPGEAARLLNTTTVEIAQDRFDAVKRLQLVFGGVAVLKGAGTLVCDPVEKLAVIDGGNPGMAGGGMGDALTGVIAGLISQGLDLYQAATFGSAAHSWAADMAAAGLGERGLLVSDLIQRLPQIINGYR
ncbi:MAG: NAD(P)H-hydrate dehydratase, partial [Immundisolibacteraceae bacterium]|nr:NAD(P)H-hydrate dehydratase [Immundisolibacteraceae bacterium]